MTYRDEAEATRARVEVLETDLATSKERADRAENELAAAREKVTAQEAELQKLRPSPVEPEASDSGSMRVLVMLLVAAVMGVGAWLFFGR